MAGTEVFFTMRTAVPCLNWSWPNSSRLMPRPPGALGAGFTWPATVPDYRSRSLSSMAAAVQGALPPELAVPTGSGCVD